MSVKRAQLELVCESAISDLEVDWDCIIHPPNCNFYPQKMNVAIRRPRPVGQSYSRIHYAPNIVLTSHGVRAVWGGPSMRNWSRMSCLSWSGVINKTVDLLDLASSFLDNL